MANIQRICSVSGCDKTVVARGYCRAHYQRWRVHGGPLEGGTARNATRAWIIAHKDYQTDECLVWPFARHPDGRAMFNGSGTNFVSRYMCELAHGAPPTPRHEAAHECGKAHEGCVNPRHLSWKTASGNQLDRQKHGTACIGVHHHATLLDIDQVRKIRALNGTASQRELGRRFNISQGAVHNILYRKTWAWLD